MDTETTGLDYMEDKPFLLGLRINGKSWAALWSPDVAKYLDRELQGVALAIFHNSKYDMHMLINGGVRQSVITSMPVWCTMLTEVLLDEHQMSYSLDNLSKDHLGVGKETGLLYERMADLYGGQADKKQMRNIKEYAQRVLDDPREARFILPYLDGDLARTEGLFAKRAPEVARQELDRVHALEMDVTRALVDLERTGIPVDRKALAVAAPKLQAMHAETQRQLAAMCGRPVNTNSTAQLIAAFNALGIPTPRQGGKITFKKSVLTDLNHECAVLILRDRSIRKIQDSFVEGLGPYVRRDSRIHTQLHQLRGEDEYGTITGRLSSSDPNMQQMPKRDDAMSAIVRSLFTAPPGQVWVNGDWSQFEFRVFAHYTRDESLLGAYSANPHIDFHQATSDLTGVERSRAKRINLGLIFGMGDGKLASELGLPFTVQRREDGREFMVPGDQAREIFQTYHSRIPGAKKVLSEATALAKQRGYVRTLLGRRMRFPDRRFTYKAAGLVFQGTSADLMKQKLVVLNREMRNIGSRLILPVHDEFNSLAPRDTADKAMKLTTEMMQDIPELRLPIIANTGWSTNWYTAGKDADERSKKR